MVSGFLRSLFNRSRHVGYPLSFADAKSGEEFADLVPEKHRYRIGPFYCDTSPDSHPGDYQHAIDFLVKDGSLVYSARSGIVTDVIESHDQYGSGPKYSPFLNYVTINHGGYYSQYAHLQKDSPSSYGIQIGKPVVRGQVIGTVGKSGWVDFGERDGEAHFIDHLHFMLFRNTHDGFESIPVIFKETV
jgi:murein DD-endopeptidase MepM/ murein hydrolase activator NlpD